MTKAHEFMTRWDGYGFHGEVFSERTREGLMGTARGTRAVPNFRPFDMIASPNQSITMFVNEDQRIGFESVCGTQPNFYRFCDFDALYFQFAGATTLETEYGIYETHPGDLLLLPGGTAHRSTGTADSLRLFAHLHEPVAHMMGADDYMSEVSFAVTRNGGPDWALPEDAGDPPKGQVVEKLITWRDTPDRFTEIDRDYEALVGVSSISRDSRESAVKKLRVFDVFKELTGAKGPGPKILDSKYFMVEVYNTRGPMRSFHRALRSEEFGLQFRGGATNFSEFGNTDLSPGDLYYVPLGIGHSVTCDDDFLRIVLYSTFPWDVVIDPAEHAFDSNFEVETNVVKPATWWSVAAE